MSFIILFYRRRWRWILSRRSRVVWLSLCRLVRRPVGSVCDGYDLWFRTVRTDHPLYLRLNAYFCYYVITSPTPALHLKYLTLQTQTYYLANFQNFWILLVLWMCLKYRPLWEDNVSLFCEEVQAVECWTYYQLTLTWSSRVIIMPMSYWFSCTESKHFQCQQCHRCQTLSSADRLFCRLYSLITA